LPCSTCCQKKSIESDPLKHTRLQFTTRILQFGNLGFSNDELYSTFVVLLIAKSKTMFKLVLILVLGLLSYNTDTTSTEPETEDLHEWAYWNAFSETFNETADYWKAESAAMEAERIAEDRTGIAEFLKDITEKENGLDPEQKPKNPSTLDETR